MAVHKTWYTVTVILLGLLFIFPSVAIIFSPDAMIPSLLAGFDLSNANMDAFNLAFLGNNIRNIVIGTFMIYFALKDTRGLVILLAMRFCIESLDLLGGLFLNPAIGELLPVFMFMLPLEGFLLIKGIGFLKAKEG